jgi:AraC-like DNA-binding protein
MTSASEIQTTAYVSVKLIAPFVAAARELGLRIDIGLASVGLTLSDLDNRDLRMSHEVVDRMLSMTVAGSGREDLGLLAAEHLHPDHLDVVEYAARARPTLRSAMEHAIRFYALLHDSLKADLQIATDRATLSISFSGLAINEAAYEFALGVHLMAARRMSGLASLAPLEVHFPHARPTQTSTHQRVFQAPVYFDRPQCAIVYSRASLERPLVAADTGLATLLDRHATASLQKLSHTAGLRSRARNVIRQELTNGKLSAKYLSRQLGISTRSLHRHLAVDGLSYRALVDEVRREIAVQCLSAGDLTIRDLSALLGFTTSPALHRAFRRWTGMSIGAFRDRA